MTTKDMESSRTTGRICDDLRAHIRKGKLLTGQLLPSVRELSVQHRVAKVTAHRALQELAAEGLVSAESRRGYRVLPGGNDPAAGCPIAYVLSAGMSGGPVDDFHKTLFSAFQQAAGARQWPFVAIGISRDGAGRAIEQLGALRASGVVVDTLNAEFIGMVRKAGIPAVMADAYRHDAEIDSVMQDNHRGGLLAATWLLERGHKKIGWIGPDLGGVHSGERFGGAATAMARAGRHLPPEMCAVTTLEQAEADALRLLSGPDRPTAMLALWRDMAVAVARAAVKLGLVIGRDLELVSWGEETIIEKDYARHFPEGEVPPAIVWSSVCMAQLALARLAERRANPSLPAMRTNVPVKLATFEKGA